ncbi:hypothetical protein LMG28614_06716 [Paraburkholderia ultramafica]|uniref:Uncharacterized protein n=1 Tax=Paraburkholderia ultramafica TaxID=1544867 RepID=A0A6S7C2T3_9BURK|nr:hypothetical protein [Paraburkholderia ultramafica]CAB3808006.1 hypothetical protein LMG28614_06716 [Paraburkholderia ultramafica]
MCVSREEVESLLKASIAEIENRYAEKLKVMGERIEELAKGRRHASEHLARRITQLGG